MLDDPKQFIALGRALGVGRKVFELPKHIGGHPLAGSDGMGVLSQQPCVDAFEQSAVGRESPGNIVDTVVVHGAIAFAVSTPLPTVAQGGTAATRLNHLVPA